MPSCLPDLISTIQMRWTEIWQMDFALTSNWLFSQRKWWYTAIPTIVSYVPRILYALHHLYPSSTYTLVWSQDFNLNKATHIDVQTLEHPGAICRHHSALPPAMMAFPCGQQNMAAIDAALQVLMFCGELGDNSQARAPNANLRKIAFYIPKPL